jgi:hypothetical protein
MLGLERLKRLEEMELKAARYDSRGEAIAT